LVNDSSGDLTDQVTVAIRSHSVRPRQRLGDFGDQSVVNGKCAAFGASLFHCNLACFKAALIIQNVAVDDYDYSKDVVNW